MGDEEKRTEYLSYFQTKTRLDAIDEDAPTFFESADRKMTVVAELLAAMLEVLEDISERVTEMESELDKLGGKKT